MNKRKKNCKKCATDTIDQFQKGPPKFKCDICNRRYFETIKLKNHYSDAHKEVKIIECEKCEFTAAFFNTMKRHMSNIHKIENFDNDRADNIKSDKKSKRKSKRVIPLSNKE